jgi:hypothetical protein
VLVILSYRILFYRRSKWIQTNIVTELYLQLWSLCCTVVCCVIFSNFLGFCEIACVQLLFQFLMTVWGNSYYVSNNWIYFIIIKMTVCAVVLPLYNLHYLQVYLILNHIVKFCDVYIIIINIRNVTQAQFDKSVENSQMLHINNS